MAVKVMMVVVGLALAFAQALSADAVPGLFWMGAILAFFGAVGIVEEVEQS